MSREGAALELKEAAPEPPAPGAADTDATEADVSEAALEEQRQPELEEGEDEEKVPMTAAANREDPPGGEPEQNGAVKLKIPEEEPEPEPFTGLNKEELLRVAGTPGWVRTRWALLVLFWLSWLGMLAGAVLIILKAPQCKELPVVNWWNEGPLYRVRSIQDFTVTGNIKGVERRLEHLLQLKVRGLVLGPVHVAPEDDAMALSFEEVSPQSGSLDQMKSLLHTAHRRGLFVVLDLSPNYGGADVWFGNSSISSITERLKSALVFWLTLGVDGVKLDSVDSVWTQVPSQWNDIRAIVQNWTDSRPHKRLLLGATSLSSASDVSSLMEEAGLDLLMSPVLAAQADATERAQTVRLLCSSPGPARLLWSLEPLGGAEEECARSDLLLLMTLPGTALIQSGDEIGLTAAQGQKFPRMIWDSQPEQNQTQQDPSRSSCLLFLSSLAALRSRERSLMFGDFEVLFNSSQALVFVRAWDQSARFLVLLNAGPAFSLEAAGGAVEPLLSGGARGKVVLSSNASALAPDTELQLRRLSLGPRESALLRLTQ